MVLQTDQLVVSDVLGAGVGVLMSPSVGEEIGLILSHVNRNEANSVLTTFNNYG